jgi:hypothetical protein
LPSFAVHVRSIYKSDSLVDKKVSKISSETARFGLQAVLMKVSGNYQIDDKNPAIVKALGVAQDYIQEYRYRNAPPSSSQPLILTLQFDPKAIEQICQDAHLTVWNTNRPLIVAWSTLTSADKTDVLDSNDTLLQPALLHESDLRGLPFVLPLMDMTDMASVNMEDIVSIKIDSLRKPTLRYKAEGILIGNVTQKLDEVLGHWELFVDDNHWQWDVNTKDMQEMGKLIIDNVTDTLAEKFGKSSEVTEKEDVDLVIKGIAEQSKLIRVMKYLERLSSVASVELGGVMQDEVTFTVTLQESKHAFLQNLASDGRLKALLDTPQDNALHYELMEKP